MSDGADQDRGGLVDAGTISLSADCVRSNRGRLRPSAGTIDATRRPTFESAPDWHLVLIGVRDGAADRVFRTAISPVPIDPSITPGPAQPVPSGPPASPGSSSSPNPSAAASAGGSLASVAAGVSA